LTTWSRLLRRLGALRRHPDFVQLVAWHEGELDEAGLEWISRHIDACPKCRLQASRIGRALGHYAPPQNGPSDPASVGRGVESLLGILRDPALLGLARERLCRELAFRLAAELGVFFGSYPMSLLEGPAARGPASRTEIVRLAETFLGREAAATLLGPIDARWKAAEI
jgi:hypothetical protein